MIVGAILALIIGGPGDIPAAPLPRRDSYGWDRARRRSHAGDPVTPPKPERLLEERMRCLEDERRRFLNNGDTDGAGRVAAELAAAEGQLADFHASGPLANGQHQLPAAGGGLFTETWTRAGEIFATAGNIHPDGAASSAQVSNIEDEHTEPGSSHLAWQLNDIASATELLRYLRGLSPRTQFRLPDGNQIGKRALQLAVLDWINRLGREIVIPKKGHKPPPEPVLPADIQKKLADLKPVLKAYTEEKAAAANKALFMRLSPPELPPTRAALEIIGWKGLELAGWPETWSWTFGSGRNGKAPDLVVGATQASGMHGTITWDGNNFVISVEGRNGLYVNGIHYQKGANVTLKPRQEFFIGHQKGGLRVRLVLLP
ncbi:MAG: FHA domain-containing protein [Deltaproteobacteria bacterium]|nr:FHA domain-containing protein [Deltaproteobacteria bacterium]